MPGKGYNFIENIEEPMLASNETKELARKALEDLNEKILNKAISETQNELSQMTESLKADVLQDKIINLIKKHKDEYTIAVAKENGAMLAKVFNTLRYEVVLNIYYHFLPNIILDLKP